MDFTPKEIQFLLDLSMELKKPNMQELNSKN
jgi:ornithine carbamoyltransferase